MSSFDIATLWERLTRLEAEKRFGGRSYPEGMTAFPFRLKGQAFFPGGDGLWREDHELDRQRNTTRRTGGVLFLGNDFGTLKSYEGLRQKGFENVPTWRHIKQRVRLAGIPTELTFFTNAILGLRTEGSALNKKSWQAKTDFAAMCGEFLLFQLDIVKPHLVVVMGPDAKVAFDMLAGTVQTMKVLYTSHPYADFGLQAERRAHDIAVLRCAWHEVTGL